MTWTEDKKTEAIKDILEAIEQGESLRSFIERSSRDVIPSRGEFYEWLSEDKELSDRYARACESRAELIFEEILDIADNVSGDKKILEDGTEVMDSEYVQRSRLKIDARKWMLGKMQPTKYGEKSTLALEGGEKPITISFED